MTASITSVPTTCDPCWAIAPTASRRSCAPASAGGCEAATARVSQRAGTVLPPLPRVSVITPAHDNEGTIGATLRSVVHQTFGDWESIVADDASSDRTAEVAAAADPRVTVVRSDTNLGPAGARNLALSSASGELVAFLDADDRWAPEYLERQVGLYDREQAAGGAPVGIVACDAWLELADGTRLGRYSERFGSAEGITLDELVKGNRIFISALATRAAVEDAGGFSTECWGSEDH